MKPYILPAILIGIVTLDAQTAPTAGNKDNNEEIVHLSEFQVTAADEETYFASETLTGSRIRSEIKELPFNVAVITSELIEDFDMADVSDALSFTASFTDNDIGPSEINMRGFSTYVGMLNGMSYFGLLTRSNMDRVEVIKGPYAAIYGQTNPGGLINYVTKQPKARPSQSLTINAGWLNYFRAMLSSSGPLTKDKKLLYRIDIGYNEKDGSITHDHSSRQEYSATLQYNFSKATVASLMYMRMINYSAYPRPPLWLRDRATNQYIGKHEDLYFNRSGPSDSNRVHRIWDFQGVYGNLEHRMNRIFSARLGGSWWRRDQPTLVMGGNAYIYNDTNTISIRPSKNNILRDNLQVQADLLAQFNMGKINNRTLISLSWSSESDWSPTWALPDSVYNDPTKMLQTLDVTAPRWFYPLYDSGEYTVVERDREQITTTSSIFISHRADFFNRRIRAFIGGRFDWVDIKLDDYLTKTAEKQITDNFSPQAGLNISLTKSITLYGSYSKSFMPQSQTRTHSQELLPSEEGTGFDFGFKTSFFNRKLNLTLGGFLITKNNVLQNYTNEEGIPTTDVAGQIKSDGAEVEINWQIGRSLQIIGGAALMDNRVTRNDEMPWTVGKLVARGPSPYNYGLAIVYRFKSGLLNGLTLRADCKGQGYSIGEYGSGPYSRTYGGVTYTFENDNKINIKQPGYVIFNAGISYKVKPDRRKSLTHTFSLNLKNITDKKYTVGNWMPRDDFTINFGYRLSL